MSTKEPIRPLANFPPSIWGDRFLNFSLDKSELEAYAKAMEEPKEQVKRLITKPTIDSNEKLWLINHVYRLGLTYIFTEEIDGQLDKLFKELNLQDYDDFDLYTTSINFQVFRQLGYKLTCDVFYKFKDDRLGTFKEDVTGDVKGLLGFYESTQLRIRGEDILDKAHAFTETRLKSLVKTLEGNLARQVEHAVMRPFHLGMPMVEARLYFSNYEEEFSSYDSLCKLAKAHFNYLQLLQKEELRILSKWWKDMDFQRITPYARDRIAELYVWILALFLEPYYSESRIITTKVIHLLLTLDDTFDAFATIEELRLLTHAINRWDITAVEQLPEYMKPFYKVILSEYAKLEKEYGKAEGKPNTVKASKEAFQQVARAYLEEAEWRKSEEMPSFEEYMKIGLVTATHDVLSKSALVGMGDIVTHQALAWYQSHPKVLQASELISRLHDDVMTFQFERERDKTATGVEAYAKSFGVDESVAIDELKKMVENAWKDINEACLKPREALKDVLAPIVNLAHMIDVAYKFNDGFTFQETTFKDYITLLFIHSLPM